MRMLKYPRLVTMLNQQLNYERIFYEMPKRSRSPDPFALMIQEEDMTESSRARSARSIEEYRHLINTERTKLLENSYKLVQEVPMPEMQEREPKLAPEISNALNR